MLKQSHFNIYFLNSRVVKDLFSQANVTEPTGYVHQKFLIKMSMEFQHFSNLV